MSPCDGPRGGNGGKPGPDKNYVKPMGESIEEAVRVPAKTGNIVDTYFNYRGKYYALKMFFPQISVPKKSDVQDQVSKVYPGAKLLTFNVSSMNQGNHSFMSKEQHGHEKQEKTKREDLTKKDESLTKERIQEATLRHLQRRLEIPAGHPFAPE